MNQWQFYKNLELLADGVLEPPLSRSVTIAGLSWLWRSLLTRWLKRLSEEQQVEYLENCIDKSVALERLAGTGCLKRTIWGSAWAFLNQPIFERSVGLFQEPQIRRISDASGRIWWQVYDPITGQTNYLESEDEVHLWLEERLYF